MTEPQIFPLASGTGFATVIHGNIVHITSHAGEFDAHVYAFLQDANSQYRSFNTAAQAADWCIAAAAEHRGTPNSYSHIEYWEVRNGHSLTISRTESGEYKPDRHPIWIDSDHIPVMGLRKTFLNLQDALQWIRRLVDDESQQEADYRNRLRQLRQMLDSRLRTEGN